MPLLTQDAVLTQIQAAQRELDMYAAIIGHPPTVQPAGENADENQEEKTPNDKPNEPPAPHPHYPALLLHTFHLDSAELKSWVSGWVKQMSHQAKRRLDEAKSRLAG